jgi:hypothetical protein
VPQADKPVDQRLSAVLLGSSEGIDISDPLSVTFVIDDGVNSTRYLNDTNAKAGRS